jgi:hypothetical protein
MEGIPVMLGRCYVTTKASTRPWRVREETRVYCILCTTGGRRSPMWPDTPDGMIDARIHAIDEHDAEVEQEIALAQAETVTE